MGRDFQEAFVAHSVQYSGSRFWKSNNGDGNDGNNTVTSNDNDDGELKEATAKARDYLEKMKREQRFLMDIWS